MKSHVHLKSSKRRFPNGLLVVHSENRAIPGVSIAAYCDAGLLCESESKAGVANLTSMLLDEGSRKTSGEAIAEQIDSMGGQFDAGPSGASIVVPSDEIESGIRLLAEILIEPAFPQSAVQKKVEWVLSEIVADEDDPKTKAIHEFRERIYGRHPLHRPINGYSKTVEKLKRQDLVTYHQQNYAPDRLILGVSGDVPFRKVERLIERYFGRWARRSAIKPPIPSIPKPTRPQLVLHDEAREQVNLYIGHVGIARTNPDYYRLLVMDHVLGTGPGFTDRLSKRLRDEQGLAYTVHAGIASSAGREPGTLTAYIGTSADRFEQAVRGMREEIRRITLAAPSSQELRLAKDYLTGSYVFGLERNLGRAFFLINKERFGLGEDYLERYPKLIESVTASQVLEASRRHIHPEALTLVAVGPVNKKRSRLLAWT